MPKRRTPVRLRKVLFIPDCHVPFEDARAFDLMRAAAERIEPDVTVILGDFADCLSVSAHSKDPKRILSFIDEVADVNDRLDEIDAIGSERKIFVEGNHEWRLPRYLADKAPELAGLLEIPDLFKLAERGWEYVPYKDFTRVGKAYVTHDAGSAGATAADRARKDFEATTVIGHVHRLGVTYGGSATGSSHAGASFGWLGDAKAADYMHRIRALRDWHLGFGLGYLEDNDTIHLQPVPIIVVDGKYSCVVEGKLVVG